MDKYAVLEVYRFLGRHFYPLSIFEEFNIHGNALLLAVVRLFILICDAKQ